VFDEPGMIGSRGCSVSEEMCPCDRLAVSMERRSYLLDHLRRYATLAELRRSPFFRECSSEIETLLSTPELAVCNQAIPRISAFVRVAQWNLEKGKQFAAIVRQFETDDVLRCADIVMLNEADCGMNRSGNRHVACCLGEALGMNVAFAPACLELTQGIDEERKLPGENCESLQGNAVLSRYPMLAAQVIRLPQCFEPYEFHEKRYGGRNCLWVRLRIGAGTLWAGSTHLEVRNTPGCRAIQMRRLMEIGRASCRERVCSVV
jgi:endonuclease/exonuclease/phosphatase family metal-dependent hydrolase